MPRRPAPTVEIVALLDPLADTDRWPAWAPVPTSSLAADGERLPDGDADDPDDADDSGIRRRLVAAAAFLVVIAVVTTAVTVGRRHDPAPRPWVDRFVIDGDPVAPFQSAAVQPFGHDGGFRVWAAGGPAEPQVVVQAMAGADQPPIVFDGSVRMVNGMPLIDVVGAPGTVVVSRNFGHGDRVLLRARGLADGDVVRIANGLVLLHSAGEVVDVQLPDTSMARLGLTEVVAAHWRDEALFGAVRSETRYLDHVGATVTLRAADGRLADSVRTLGHLAGAEPTQVGDRFMAIPTDTGEPVVLWQQNGQVLSLQGPGDPGRLLAWSRSVRPMTRADWEGTWSTLAAGFTDGPVVTLASGFRWAAAVQRADLGRTMAFRWQFTDPGDASVTVTTKVRFRPSVMPFADRIVVGRTTYVFVSMPASVAGSAEPSAALAAGAAAAGFAAGEYRGRDRTTAVVRYGDGRSVEVTLRRPFPDLQVLMGAVRIDEPGPVSVLAPATLHD